ncbi:type I restriction-modification system subunit M [Bacteroides fluxus]|jgi:type I restriction enzyme M protein
MDQLIALIWNIADDVLRDVFLRGQYRDVILPMVVLRRLDALLESTKEAVETEYKKQIDAGFSGNLDEEALKDESGQTYYNLSKWTLNRLKSQASDNNDINYANFIEYLNGYSENVKDVLKNFEFYAKVKKLADNDRLLSIIERITDPRLNLTDRPATDPDGLPLPAVSNLQMGTLFEELLRRFNEENNEEAGEHFTPRDVIELLAKLVFEPVKDNLPKIITLYDPACGSGGMLTEGRDYLLNMGITPNAINMYGTEVNPETYAICKSDFIIKGVDPEGMHRGNTITDDYFHSKQFGYMLTNPPYGKSWKEDKKRLYHDKDLMDARFNLKLTNFIGEEEIVDSTPRTSDGQLLFILEEVDKMKSLEFQPQGSRVASIHNGSSLFTGDAGSGESNIRRYLIENNLVDAIVQLPNNIFYNTGISTYVWLLSNHKQDQKVQLIDASKAFDKLRKNLGNRNCEITSKDADDIVRIYMSRAECEANDDVRISSKVFDGDDFRYYSVQIERPLRLRCHFSAIKCDELLYDSSMPELSKWLYTTYGDKVFAGLEKEVAEIKEYLNDNELKLTDKKFSALVNAGKWKERRALQQAALKLMHQVGSEEYDDYNLFLSLSEKANKALGLKLTAAQLKTILRTNAVQDATAQPVVAKTLKAKNKDIPTFLSTYGIDENRLADYGYYARPDGTFVIYEADSNLRDTEKINVKEDIWEYVQREVKPYVPEAWINLHVTKIGCEISFNKYFYKPVQLRSLEENERDILDLDRQSKGLIQSLFEKL